MLTNLLSKRRKKTCIEVGKKKLDVTVLELKTEQLGLVLEVKLGTFRGTTLSIS